jgi:hypothetical protein
MSLLKQGDERILTITKNMVAASISGPVNATDILGSLTFKLSDLPELSSFTNIYEQYKFVKVEVSFIPLVNLVNTTTGTPASHPLLVVIDYNNNGNPPNINALLDYTNLKITPCNKAVKITLQPHSLALMYDGSAGQAGGSIPAQWITTTQTSIVHYGIRYGIKSTGSGTIIPQNWAVYLKYTVLFKGVY